MYLGARIYATINSYEIFRYFNLLNSGHLIDNFVSWEYPKVGILRLKSIF